MADDGKNVFESAEKIIENAGVSNWQTGLASAVNETYSYGNSSLFYGMLPAYYRDYGWRYIRVACQWLDGYVTSLHQSGYSGIISTRIASKLITGLTKQIVGEKIIFKLNDRNSGDGHETLHFVSEWSNEQDIIKAIYGGIGFALGIGTSLIKMNRTIDGNIWWESVRFDNCYYTATFKNEVTDATFLIRNYADTSAKVNKDQFFLVEHRYYKTYELPQIDSTTLRVIHKKGERVPMVEYKVRRVTGTTMNNTMPTNANCQSLDWNQIPYEIRRMIKNDYGSIRIGQPEELGFIDLGVVPLLNGEMDLSVPTGTNFGESMIVGIQDDLITYEIASSYLIRDMYLGKGAVYVPKSLNQSDLTGLANAGTFGNPLDKNMLGGIGDTKYEMVSGVDPDKQSIVVQQFEIRADQWQLIKENCLRNIGVKWGMSPKILASFLTNGQAAQTATQIDSEDDNALAFIYHTRAYFKNALNKLLKTTLAYYGRECNVTLDFASPSLINKDRLLDRVTKQLENGLITLEEAIRTLNPDLEEEAVQKKIDDALKQQMQMQLAQMQQMNDDGTFGGINNYDDLGGDNLNGTTSPIQG